MSYEPTIGLEIHIELKTRTKMFCDCLNNSEEKHPNLNICPICTGQPGVLPTINEKAVESVLLAGLALNCEIPKYSKFDRKNYFYPDLPKGYQISQYDKPLCLNGYLDICENSCSNSRKLARIRIKRIHLEEDAGRLVHSSDGSCSLIDFNRAGIPLMELVTEPDIKSSKEAKIFAEELRLILRYLNIADADMEKGEMRIEVNISLREIAEQRGLDAEQRRNLGTKVEIKNLNSFRAAEEAIDYEIKRQTDILEKGDKITHETRGWDENKKRTFSQRFKEEAHDYRYFPEPDLPPLNFSDSDIEKIRLLIPELPRLKRIRLADEYKLSPQEADLLAQSRKISDFFEKTISEVKNLSADNQDKMIKLCFNFLTTDLFALMKNDITVNLEETKISPANFASLINLFGVGQIGSRVAKDVLKEMYQTGAPPLHIIQEQNLLQVSDDEKLTDIIYEVISENERAISDYKKGKLTALQFLVGKAMAKTKGSANPEKLKELFQSKLTE